ncbi:MAG TPA: class I SAM-dependent methyltransferase [Thermoanaerobaculia bacterium]|jgi:SAM-dependent methyltransferase
MPDIYTDGTYLANNPGWHEEDAAWKATRIVDILRRNNVQARTIAEVGCGSGAVLEAVSRTLGATAQCVGYDISPQAAAIAGKRTAQNLSFVHGDLLTADVAPFDVLLAIDVIEHVDDCLGFVRKLKARAREKVFHIPLDLSVQSVLRASPIMQTRREVGHIHYFTKETALATLTDAGLEIVDWFYTSGAIDLPAKALRGRLAKLPRAAAFRVAPDLAARVLGGFSVMVLAR